jgi:hypothetical protein
LAVEKCDRHTVCPTGPCKKTWPVPGYPPVTRYPKRENAELVINGKNGKIQDSDSYGNDPNPPKDQKH